MKQTAKDANWISVSLFFYFCFIAASGFFGFTRDSSPGVARVLGVDGATWLFSGALLFFGVLGSLSTVFNIRTVEFWCVIGVCGASLVHGMSLILTSTAGTQTGIRIVASVFSLLPLAVLRVLNSDELSREVQSRYEKIQREGEDQ